MLKNAAPLLIVLFLFAVNQAKEKKYQTWEKPLKFTRTYYVDGSAANADDNGPGSRETPFRTINHAARILKPGERVIIAEGVYRESIHPVRGGSGPDKMISYEAAEGAKVVVKGSVELNEGWKPSEGWLSTPPGLQKIDPETEIWELKLDGRLFDGYNPFGLVNVLHDRYWLDYAKISMTPFFRRRGMVFVDGKPLEQVELYRELIQIGTRALNAYSEVRRAPLFDEMTGYAGKFWVEHNGMTLHIRLANDDSPKNHKIEITTKEQVFAPLKHHLGYIRVKGITFEHAANGFPVPQRGLVSTSRGHHWIIEDNTIKWANSVALDIGKEHWSAVNPEIRGHHIIRNNHILNIGICGIAGLAVENLLVENNLLEWIGWQDAQRMWESSGVKFHFAKNLMFRNNIIRHTRYASGI